MIAVVKYSLGKIGSLKERIWEALIFFPVYDSNHTDSMMIMIAVRRFVSFCSEISLYYFYVWKSPLHPV